MKNNGSKTPDIHIPQIKTMKVGHDKTDVIWQIGNDKTQRLPWEAAIYFSKAIMAQARRIEELKKAGQIIDDQALLLGHGFPIGLTNDPAMLDEARKTAVNNPKLRKLGGMGGIESTERVGKPRIIQHPPKKEENDGKD